MQQHPYPGTDPFIQQPAPQGPAFTASQIRRIARAKLKGKWKQAALPVIVYALFAFVPTLLYAIFSFSDMMNGVAGSADLTAVLMNSMTDSESESSLLSGIMGDFTSLYQIVTAGAFGIGISTLALNIIRDEKFSVSTIFTGFNKFGQSFLAGVMVTIFSALWMCLFILPGSFLLGMSVGFGGFMIAFLAFAVALMGIFGGIIFTMRYHMSYFIAADDRQMRASAVVAYSVALMRKRVVDLFALEFSFIGWIILAAIPLYVSMLIITFMGTSVLSCAGALVFAFLFVVVYAFVVLYMTTAKAIFYSTVTGNFKAQPSNIYV